MLLASSDSSSWYSEPKNIGGLLRLLMYPIVFVAAMVRGWRHKRKEKMALAWPSVEGCVQFARVAPIRDSNSYSATLQYSYFVEEYRSGEYAEVFDSENDADKFAQRMKGQKVPVRYSPKSPDQSLIEEADVEQYVQLPPVEREVPLRS
jgi:hypothetical protein